MQYLSSIILQVAMCNFPSIKDAADVAIATMHSGIQVGVWLRGMLFMYVFLICFTNFPFIFNRYQG